MVVDRTQFIFVKSISLKTLLDLFEVSYFKSIKMNFALCRSQFLASF